MRQLFIVVITIVQTLVVSAQTISHIDTLSTYEMHGTYYSDRFVGRKTSSGEIFRQDRYTAAHKTLKFGTLLLVTNTQNGKQVIVKVNDRCPKHNVLDMSKKAAKQIGVGSQKVAVQVLPERYKEHWQNQEKIKHILVEGSFWAYIKEPHKANKEKRSKGRASQQSTLARSVTKAQEEEQKKEEKKENRVELYNIELGVYRSRNTAQKKANGLPIYYLDLISYQTDLKNHNIILILNIESPKMRAEEVQKSLKEMFPESRIVWGER